MTQLREFARRSETFEKLNVQVVALSVDDQSHAREVWEKVANRRFRILSDPEAQVIRKYGLLHSSGYSGADIALRTTILIGPDGREAWRRVSESVPDIPSVDEVLTKITKAQERARGMDSKR